MQTTTSRAFPAKDSARGWSVVFATFIGLLLSFGVLVIYSFGVVISAMSDEFGWSGVERSTLFVALSLSGTFAGVGWAALADRFGGQRIVFASSALLALAFVLVASLPSDRLTMHLLFVLLGVVGSGTFPPTFAGVIVGWFDRNRGLALGIAMTGIGVGAAAIPPIAAALTTSLGWRQTYYVFAGAIILVVLPATLLLLRAHPDSGLVRREAAPMRGVMLRSAFRTRALWILAVFAILTGAILVTSVANFVAILQSRGESLVVAARYQAILGLSLIAGRILIGTLIDRVFAPFVMLAVLLATTAGFYVLYDAATPLAFIVSAAGIGLAIGAEVDFLGFMVSRYFERATFTTIFAVLFSLYALGGSLAPLAFAWLAQQAGTYQPGLAIFAALSLVLALSMLLLPRYAPIDIRSH